MELLIKVVQFLASLSLLIIIHEFGHFIFARMFGVRVEKFYLFFDPWFSLCKFRIGETEFGIGWIPFGGYAKISGMIDESMDTGQMAQPPKPYELRSKPAWQRLLVMGGGVLMNVLLAIIIYIGMSYAWGERYIANEDIKYGYVFNDLGHEAGFVDGDRVLKVDGRPVENYLAVYKEIVLNSGPEVEVLRDGEVVVVRIPDRLLSQMLNSVDFMTPRMPFVIGGVAEGSGAAEAGLMKGDSLVALNGTEIFLYDEYRKAMAAQAGERVEVTYVRKEGGVPNRQTVSVLLSDEGTLGVYAVSSPAAFFPVRVNDYTFAQAVPVGLKKTGAEIKDYWKQVKMIFSPKTEAYKSVGGFISIGSIFPSYWSWEAFWHITALLSLVLAVMNILPIPALDGGHIMFILFEIITRRKPSQKFMETAQIAGMLFLFGLIIYANLNDIYRFFIK